MKSPLDHRRTHMALYCGNACVAYLRARRVREIPPPDGGDFPRSVTWDVTIPRNLPVVTKVILSVWLRREKCYAKLSHELGPQLEQMMVKGDTLRGNFTIEAVYQRSNHAVEKP